MEKEKIYVFDTTLRDGEQSSGFHMHEDEKLKIAHALAEMSVDIIEAGFPVSSPMDWRAVNRIAGEVYGPTICGLSMCREDNIVAAGEALQPAIQRGKGRIHVFIATSQIHTEDKLRKPREEIIRMAVESVRFARNYTDDVEFSTEDFGRSDTSYIVDIVTEIIKAGATTINLPDTVGYLLPRELGDKIRETIGGLRNNIDIANIVFSCHVHNDLGNATASSCEAVLAGIRQIEVTMNGIGERAGNAALEEVIANIKERGKYRTNPQTGKKDPFYELDIGHIDTTKIYALSQMVAAFTGNKPQKNKAIVGDNAFSHEAGVHQDGMIKSRQTYEIMDPGEYGRESTLTYGPRSGRRAIRAKYKEFGFEFEDHRFEEVYGRFMGISDNKKETSDEDLFLAMSDLDEVPAAYLFVEYIPVKTNDGFEVTVKLRQNGENISATGRATGQIDAAVHAINGIVQMNLDIADYKSESVVPGASAEGLQRLAVKSNGYVVKSQGISSDVIEGTILAYVNAVNKMSFINSF